MDDALLRGCSCASSKEMVGTGETDFRHPELIIGLFEVAIAYGRGTDS